MFELKNCYMNSNTFIMASSTDITDYRFELVGIVMDPIEFVQILEPPVKYYDSEIVSYGTTEDDKPEMTVTINNNEVSPTFVAPNYELIIPHGYTMSFDLDYGECEGLEEYTSVEIFANPDNEEQSFLTFLFDLSNIYEFDVLSCSIS